MMVERSPYIENVGQLIRDLDQATMKLEEINRKPQAVSKQELNDLIKTLQNFNTILDPAFWEDKKLAFAIQLFQRYHPERDRTSQRNVDQAITSLFSALNSALNAFDKNLRDLKKYKIGRKVEKSGESKHS
jgi:hypothetical protein